MCPVIPCDKAPCCLLCVCGSKSPLEGSTVTVSRMGWEWGAIEWGAMGWDGNGVQWDGVQWNGMGWDAMGWAGWDAPAARPLLVGHEGSASGPRRAAKARVQHSGSTQGLLCLCRQGLVTGQFSTAELTGYTSGDWLKMWIPLLATLTHGLCSPSLLLSPNTRLVRASLLTATRVLQTVRAVRLVKMKIWQLAGFKSREGKERYLFSSCLT